MVWNFVEEADEEETTIENIDQDKFTIENTGPGLYDDPSEGQIEFPMDPATLVLNPNGEELEVNPLCPKCKEEIVAVVGDYQRRFVCGCDNTWMFSFKEGDPRHSTDKEVNNDEEESYDSPLKKDEDEDVWEPWETDEE